MENIHNGGGGSVPSLVNMFSAPGRKSFKPFHITVVSRCIAVQLSRPQYIAGFYFFKCLLVLWIFRSVEGFCDI